MVAGGESFDAILIQFRKFFERSETNFIKDLKENLPRNLLLEVVN